MRAKNQPGAYAAQAARGEQSQPRVAADRVARWAPRSSPLWPFICGIPLLFVALFLQTVTIARGGYAVVLVVALALTTVAAACFIYAFRRGGTLVRFGSALCLLPTLFVVSDFLRRAPYVLTGW